MATSRQDFAALMRGYDVVVYDVPPELDGQRADRFLVWAVPRLSRSRANAIIKGGGLEDMRGRALKPSTSMQGGTQVRLVRELPDSLPPPEALKVLYEDADMVVVDKPGDLTIHRTARHVASTLQALLASAYPDEPPQPVHRLDRETSGLVVCGRHDAAVAQLTALFDGTSKGNRGVEKRYRAVVEGVPEPAEQLVDVPMMLDPNNEVRVTMCVHPGGLPAKSQVETRRRGPGGRSEVEVKLLTGRQHQIRVHLAAIGHPIVGDKLYGPDPALFLTCMKEGVSDERRAILGHHRHALHAWSLHFEHPTTGEAMALEAPFPAELEALLEAPTLAYEPGLITY